MKSWTLSRRSTWLTKVLALTLANCSTGVLALLLANPPESAPTLWPPAGIALAGLLLFGYHVWPGVWLGAFLAHTAILFDGSSSTAVVGSLAVAASLGLGDSLNALAGAWLVRRVLGKDSALDSLIDVLVLIVLAGVVGASVSATVATTARAAFSGVDHYPHAWWAEWRASAVGVLVFAPLVMTLATTNWRALSRERPYRVVEGVLLFVGGLIGLILVTGKQGNISGAVCVAILAFWSTVRFGTLGTAVCMVMFAMFMAWDVKQENALLGAIKTDKAWRVQTAQYLQGFMSITFWVLVALQNERRRVMRELQDNETAYRNLVELSPDAVMILVDGCIGYCNAASLRLLGVQSPKTVLGKPVSEFLHPDDHAASAARIRTIRETGQPVPPYHYRAHRLDGEPVDVETRAGPCVYAGKAATQVVVRDITERKRAEEALRAAQQRLQYLITSSPTVLYTLTAKGKESLRLAWMSENIQEMMGYSSEEIFDLAWWHKNIHPEDMDWVTAKEQQELFARGRVASEYRFRHLDGTYRWVRSEMRLLRDAAGRPVEAVGSWSDVTERKLAEEKLHETESALRKSELRYKELFDNSSDCLFMLDVTQDGRFKLAGLNPAEEEALGRKSSEVSGKFVEEIIPEPIARQVTANYRRCVEAGSVIDYEEELDLPVGHRAFHTILIPLRDASGRVHRIDGVGRDVSERKRAMEQLRASLREKEALLKEVHHRVKNNLQIISSLLRLQSQQIADPTVLAAFTESQNRVHAMAVVHETLYRSEDFAQINLASYLEDLCAHLFRAYALDPTQVRLDVRVAGVTLDLDRAAPCGLLINELVSNALKYAFPGGRSGRLAVELGATPGGAHVLTVSDDGVGLPASLDFRRARTLGLQLVCGLIQQLGGTIDLDRTTGTKFTMTFTPGSPAEGGSRP